RVNVSTQAEGIRSPKGGVRGVRRRRKGFAYASSVSGWHNVIALAMVCCSPHANSGPGGGARGRAFYFHNSSGTAAALNPAKSFAAIRITTTPYPQQVTGSQQATIGGTLPGACDRSSADRPRPRTHPTAR